MKRPREIIYTQTVCGVKVPVVRVDQDSPALRDDDGSRLEGTFDDKTNTIFLRRGMTRSAERDTINHELLHALLILSGARNFLTGGSREPDRAHDNEETLVRILTPHLAAIGWAK